MFSILLLLVEFLMHSFTFYFHSFSKPVDTRRPKMKTEAPYNLAAAGLSSPPKKKKTTQPDSVIMSSNGEGPLPQFQCKVCGRYVNLSKNFNPFNKVKDTKNTKSIFCHLQNTCSNISSQRKFEFMILSSAFIE